MSVGNKIYELRKRKNMSQEDLASVLNVSRQTISKWETGESSPDIDKIVPLCECFEITTDQLLKEEKMTKKTLKKEKNKAGRAICTCILIFVIMVCLITFLDEIRASDFMMASVAVLGMGGIAMVLVYYFLNREKDKTGEQEQNKRMKVLNSICDLTMVIVYLLVSFLTQAWEYTWMIFLVGLLIKKILVLINMLGEEKNGK